MCIMPTIGMSLQSIEHQTVFSFQAVALERVHFPPALPDFLVEALAVPEMCDHLARFGQLQPLPALQLAPDVYRLIGGYTVFASMRRLGKDAVLCQVMQAAKDPLHEYTLRVLLDATALQASPVLCACLLREAQEDLNRDEILSLLPHMGYKAQNAVLEHLLRLLDLTPLALLALHQGQLTMKSALRLLDFSSSEQELLLRCILACQLGGSKQQKLVDMLRELGRRHDRNIAYWLEAWLVEHEGNPSNRPQHLQNFFCFLQEQCSPALSQAEKDFSAFVRDLKPCAGVQLRHSPCFEDSGIDVSVQFSDREAVRKHWQKIRELALLASETAP